MAWRTTLFSPNQISLHTQNHTQNLSVETEEEEEVILVFACTRNTSMPFANGKNRHAKRKKHWSSSLMIYRTSFVCAFKCIIWTVSTQPFSFRFPHTEMMTFNGIEMGFNPKQLLLCFAQIKWSQSVWVRLVEECWKNDWMTIHHGVMWSILYENGNLSESSRADSSFNQNDGGIKIEFISQILFCPPRFYSRSVMENMLLMMTMFVI